MKPFAVLAVAATLLLSGCTPIVAMQPADDAINTECASVVVSLPDVVGGREIDLEWRETNAQGTGAYGNPSAVLVRCGVTPPAPTSQLPCVQVGDVFWLRDDTQEPTYVFTTYGRTPAVEVVIDSGVATPGVVLYDLEGAVSQTTAERQCTSIEDSLGTNDGVTTPTP